MLNCSCQSNCFCLWVCLYLCAQLSHRGSGVWMRGNVELLFKIFSWRLCAKAELPLGSLPPALLIILPFHPMPWLNPWETSGPLSHTRLLCLYPLPPCRFASPPAHTANKLSQCASVYVCMHASFFFSFFFWELIRITITGMWFESRPLPVA